MSEKTTDGKSVPSNELFANLPMPWTFDPKTRNVTAANGCIVARAGDSVCDAFGAGPFIAEMPGFRMCTCGMIPDPDCPCGCGHRIANANADLPAVAGKVRRVVRHSSESEL